MPRKSKGAKAVQSKEDALAEAKSLYTSLVPQLKAAGVPLDELNTALFDDVLGKLTTPIETLLKALQDTMSSSSGVSKSVDKLGASLTSGLSTFMASVPLGTLFDQLLPKLVNFVQLIGAALANPALLSPSLSCANTPLPADLQSGAATAASTLGDSLFGGNSTGRSRLWSAFSARFDAAFAPLRDALPQLKELPAVCDAVQKSYADVSAATTSIKKLGKAQDECQALLKALLDELSGEKVAGAAGADVNFMERVELVVTKAKGLDGFGATLATASAAFSGAANAVFSFFRSLEFLVMKVTQVSWAPLLKSMSSLHAHYGPMIADARKIMAPSGALAAFMKPSPYLVRIEDAVADVQKIVNLDDVSTKMSAAANVFFPLLELPGIGSGGGGGGAAAAPGEASAFSTKSLGPIRDSLDSLLQMTKSQQLVFGNATQSLTSVLQVDVVSLMNTNVDKFSAAAARKLADTALAEAQKLKDTVLAEVAQMKAQMVAQIQGELDSIKKQASDEAEKIKAQALGEIAKIKSQALDEVAKLRAQAQDEVTKLRTAAQAEALKQANEMKAAMLGEAKKEIEQLRSQALGQLKSQGGSVAADMFKSVFN
jgi:vacuolar-type H+-ATPase subunit E/Vma4